MLLVTERDKNIVSIIIHAFTVKNYAHWWEKSNDKSYKRNLQHLYKYTLHYFYYWYF